jgi:alkylated DNA repair dioxygenase AlkB
MNTLFNVLNDNDLAVQVNGLIQLNDFLSKDDELKLLELIDSESWQSQLSRRVQQYGSPYVYNKLKTNDAYVCQPMPSWLVHLAKKIYENGNLKEFPNQVIINEYMPGQGIAAHVDCPEQFGESICSLSLGSDCVMILENLHTKNKQEIILRQKSLLILNGDARYEWTHKIPPRKNDIIFSAKIPRSRRVSVTFRYRISNN